MPGRSTPLVQLSASLWCFQDICNVYIVVRGSRALLIDFGSGSVLKHLSRLGVTRLDWILHTHHHRDQCCGHLDLAHGAKVAVPAAERQLFEDAELFWRTRSTASQYDCASHWNTLASDIPVQLALQDHECLAWNGVELHALPTPGHTRGSVTYLAEIDGVRCAFSGDLVFAGGRTWTLHDLQWNYDEPDGLALAIESVRCLERERPDLLAPSHGPTEPVGSAALARLRRNLIRLYELLEPGYGPNGGEPNPHPPAVDYEQLTEHLIAVRRGNADFYVLRCDSGQSLFFDYGYPGWAHCQGAASRFLVHSLTELRERFGALPPEVVVPTHYHDDHVCGIPYLARRFGTEVWAHEAFERILRRPTDYRLPCLWPQSVVVDRRVDEGGTIAWRGFEFEAWHMPGHTHYAAGFFGDVDGERVAIVGDQLALDRRGRARGGGPVYRNRVAVGDFATGIDRVIRFQPDLILTGHQGALRLSRGQLLEAQRWAVQLDDVWAALAPAGAAPGLALDPDFATIVPYFTAARPGVTFALDLRLRNHLRSDAAASCALNVPAGWRVSPARRTGWLNAGQEGAFSFEVVPPKSSGRPRSVITADVCLGGSAWGQPAEAIVDLTIG